MGPSGTGWGALGEVALRAFRSPASGLATMLASVAAEVPVSLVAAYLLPVNGPTELLAAGGRDATALGPPGRTSDALAERLRLSELDPASSISEVFREEPPWDRYPHFASPSIMLPDGMCVLGAAAEQDVRPEDLDHASAPVGLLAHLLVTKREADRLRGQLRELSQDRSLLAAGLQHDLKAPLTSIYGMAQTLLSRGPRLGDETRHDLLESVASQAQRLNRMISQTLEKHSAGIDSPVRMQATPLKPLAERVASAASSGRGGEVMVETPEVSVTTDADRLERALLNLLDNALKYSPEHVPAHLIVETDDSHVTITVADNGPGVSSDVLPGLFGAYTSDPDRAEGTGLGLHSARYLVEQLGGRVGYSRHSDWTRFTITLSARSEEG